MFSKNSSSSNSGSCWKLCAVSRKRKNCRHYKKNTVINEDQICSLWKRWGCFLAIWLLRSNKDSQHKLPSSPAERSEHDWNMSETFIHPPSLVSYMTGVFQSLIRRCIIGQPQWNEPSLQCFAKPSTRGGIWNTPLFSRACLHARRSNPHPHTHYSLELEIFLPVNL